MTLIRSLASPICVAAFFAAVGASPALPAQDDAPAVMTAADLAEFPNPPSDHRIYYGDGPLQFADLRLPQGEGPHPVMILIHGGCWLSQFDITHIGKLADAFAREGIATWALEYRRVGDEGGGWPGTFADIARGADHLRNIAHGFSLDLDRVIVGGHSAGGHLALWLAARQKFAPGTAFAPTAPLTLRGVLALAPAPDLEALHEQGVCDDVIDKLMGGGPMLVPERYALASLMQQVPLNVPQMVVLGRFDDYWAPAGRSYFNAAAAVGDSVQLIEATESGHFEMIDPDSSTWPLVLQAARDLLR